MNSLPEDRNYIKIAKEKIQYFCGFGSTKKAKQAPVSNRQYYPDHIIGVCQKCHTQGTLEFPPGTFTWNGGDRVMSLEVLKKVFCLSCRKYTEFIPFDPKKHDAPGHGLLGRNQNDILGNLE